MTCQKHRMKHFFFNNYTCILKYFFYKCIALHPVENVNQNYKRQFELAINDFKSTMLRKKLVYLICR